MGAIAFGIFLFKRKAAPTSTENRSSPWPTFALICAGLLAIWLFIATLIASAPPVAWWRCLEWLFAWCTALTAARSLRDRQSALVIFSAASATAAIASVTLSWWFTDWSLGFGNPNYLITATLPGVAAGIVLILGSAEFQWRTPKTVLVLLMLATLCLAWFSWEHGRRMPIVALGGGLAFMAIYALGQWRPWARILGFFILLIAVAATIVVFWDLPVRDVRLERVQIWKAALDQILERPFGWGAVGTLRVTEALGEAARHLTAGGHLDRHAHMEILDITVAGGIPALILCLLSTAGLIASVKTRNDESNSTGLALAGGLGAWLVCWSLDNGQSELPILIIGAIWCGLILGNGANSNISLDTSRILSSKTVSCAGIISGIILGWGLFPSATLPWNQPKAHLEWALHQTYQADLTLKFYDTLSGQARAENDMAKLREYTELAVRRLGWAGNTEVNALTTATNSDDPAELIRLSSSFCHHHPFHPLGLAFTWHILQSHPAMTPLISPRLLRRITVWHGNEELQPALKIYTIEDAADATAMLNAALRLHRPQPPFTSDILERLVIKYGDLADIGLLILTCRAEWGETCAPWAIERATELRWALIRQPGALTSTLRQLEQKPRASAILWPVLEKVFPITAAAFFEGTSAADPSVDQELRLLLLRFRSNFLRVDPPK